MSNRSYRIMTGQRGVKYMPASEVCMSMRVTDKPMIVELLSSGRMVQLYTLDGRPFSAPITTGEAGIFEDSDGFYFYPNEYSTSREADLADHPLNKQLSVFV